MNNYEKYRYNTINNVFLLYLFTVSLQTTASEKALATDMLSSGLTAVNQQKNQPTRELHLKTKSRYQNDMRAELLGTDADNSKTLFVCWGLMLFLNIWGHIATVPTCSSGTLTNVFPHRNAIPQTQDMTPQPVTVYRHRAELSLCYWCGTSHCNTQLPIFSHTQWVNVTLAITLCPSSLLLSLSSSLLSA